MTGKHPSIISYAKRVHDLAAQQPERVAAMLKIMDERHQPSPIFPNKTMDR